MWRNINQLKLSINTIKEDVAADKAAKMDVAAEKIQKAGGHTVIFSSVCELNNGSVL